MSQGIFRLGNSISIERELVIGRRVFDLLLFELKVNLGTISIEWIGIKDGPDSQSF